MRTLILCLLLATVPAHAREWTDSERRWAMAALAVYAVDMLQTRHIAKHPDQFHEKNPLMPRNPSTSDVHRHFVIGSLVMLGVAHFLPAHRKRFLQVVTVGLGVNVTRNFHVGVRLAF